MEQFRQRNLHNVKEPVKSNFETYFGSLEKKQISIFSQSLVQVEDPDPDPNFDF